MQRHPRQVAEDLGVAGALRAVRGRVVRTARRNRTDDRNLTLLLSFVLREDSNCVDIGAYDGSVLRQMTRFAPRGHHVAFEPLPYLHARLATEFPDVDVRGSALSDVEGTAPFTHVVSRPGYSGFKMRIPAANERIETFDVAVTSLDDALAPGFRPTLVKIDVEGAEYQVLKGGRKILAETQPYLVFEFGAASAAHYGTTPDDMFSLVTDDIGLRIYDLDGAGPYSRAAFRAVYETDTRFNFVAHV
jgi:FkbM family methyltransferase